MPPVRRSKRSSARRGPPCSLTSIVNLPSLASLAAPRRATKKATKKRASAADILPKQDPHPDKDPRRLRDWLPEGSIVNNVLTELGLSAITKLTCGRASMATLREMRRNGEVVRMRDEPDGAELYYLCTLCHLPGIGDKCKSRHANKQQHRDKVREHLDGVIVNPVKVFVCNLCNRSVSRIDSLTRHTKAKHKEIIYNGAPPDSTRTSSVQARLQEDERVTHKHSIEVLQSKLTDNSHPQNHSQPRQLIETSHHIARHWPYTSPDPHEQAGSPVYLPHNRRPARLPSSTYTTQARPSILPFLPPPEFLDLASATSAFTFKDISTGYFPNHHTSYGTGDFTLAWGAMSPLHPSGSREGSLCSEPAQSPLFVDDFDPYAYSSVFDASPVGTQSHFDQAWYVPSNPRWEDCAIQPFYGGWATAQTQNWH